MVRERFVLDESITSEHFVNILAELNNNTATSERVHTPSVKLFE